MTTFVSTHPVIQIRSAARERDTEAPTGRPRLCATEDGWSLLGADGELIVRGLGHRGRRECLEAAQRMGILVLAS